MSKDYQNLTDYAAIHLIEQIMALAGRGLAKAREYRTDLESMTLKELRRELELIETDNEGQEL